jgi:AraC family transcriptional activator of tynA and feaB
MAAAAPAELLSTEVLPLPRQYEAWRDAVSATHLAWDLPRRSESAFNGKIRRQPLGAADIIQCRCDPCQGRRGRAEIARAGEATYGLLYIVGGRERIYQDDAEITLRAGTFMIWDSTRRIDFRVPETLQKITLMLPQRMMEAALPNARDLTGIPVSAREGSGALFATHLRSLARQGAELPAAQHDAVLQATLSLMSTAFETLAVSAGADPRRKLIGRISGHILRNLADPALTPERIADSLCLSQRQLHRVFRISGWTVERWIWHQRLLRCRQELDLREKTPISQIAFRWGFSDAAHFSRAFRDAFGASPRDYRNRLNA